MPEDYRVRLRAARIAAGLTQRELAEAIHCAPSTVGTIELLQRHLTAPKLFAWATACGVTLEHVAHGTPQLEQPVLEHERVLQVIA